MERAISLTHTCTLTFNVKAQTASALKVLDLLFTFNPAGIAIRSKSKAAETSSPELSQTVVSQYGEWP